MVAPVVVGKGGVASGSANGAGRRRRSRAVPRRAAQRRKGTPNVTPLWAVVVDDKLARATEAAAFLQSFCPPAADPVWSADYFRWKLGATNPAGAGFCTLALFDNRVIGCATITRKRLWGGEREEIGGELGDCYTDPAFLRRGRAAINFPGRTSDTDYLNRSVFGRMVTETRERAEAAGLRLIYGTPNANAMPGYRKRLGFPEYESHRTENYLRPTVAGLGERFPVLRPWTAVLAPLDRVCALVGDAAAGLRAPGLTVTPFEGDDGEIDALWDRVKIAVPFSLVRDARWFRYRFDTHPLNKYDLLAVRRGGDLRALVVTRRFITMRGRPYCYIADWLFADEDARCFARALARIVRVTPPRDFDGVLLWAEERSSVAAMARANVFMPRGKSPIVFADTAEAAALALRAPRIDFSIAFSDNV